MISKISLILISLALVVSCAKKIDHGNDNYKLPIETENLNQDQEPDATVSTALCKDVFMCPHHCKFNYPFKDEQEINDEFTAKGLFGSPENIKAISENDILINKYNACLLLPANQTTDGYR